MANPMSKSKIIAYMTEKVSTKDKPVSKKQVVSFFDELFNLAVKEAKSAGKFVIPGIGRAVKAHRKARMGRNPATGEAIKIKAKTVVRLRAAKAFKDAVLKEFGPGALSQRIRGEAPTSSSPSRADGTLGGF